MTRLNVCGAGALLLLSLAGCATRDELQNVSRDLDEVKTRMLQTQKELNAVRSEAGEKMTVTLKGYQEDLETIRKQQADLQANLDSAKVDLQVMTGKIDENALQAQKPVEELGLLKEDLERRLAGLEERMIKLEKGFEEVQKKAAEPPPVPVAKSPESLYQQAMDTFKAGKFTEARDQFNAFQEKYPSHDLVPNARYWVGEAYYSEKKYEQAILEFQDLIKKYPGKTKVPAAMLKQGMAFIAIGDDKSAKYVLKKVTEEYPLADEAKTAAEKLKGL